MSKKPFSKEGQILRLFLKHRMRLKDISYKDLAEILKLPEIRIKRWMSGQDLKIENLVQLSHVLGFHLTELFQGDFGKRSQLEIYTEAQEQFKLDFPQESYFFLKLRYGKTLKEAAEAADLPARSIPKILKQLEKLGYLTLHPEDKIQIRFSKASLFRKGGNFMKILYPSFINALFDHFKLNHSRYLEKPDFSGGPVFVPFEVYLTKELGLAMSRELRQVVTKYRQLSAAIKNEKALEPVAGLVTLDFYDAWKQTYMQRAQKEKR